MGEVIFKALAAWVFATVLVLSSHAQPTDVTTKPSIPCYDPAQAGQEVTLP